MGMTKCVFTLDTGGFPYEVEDYFHIEGIIANSRDRYDDLKEDVWYITDTPTDGWLYYVSSLPSIPTKDMDVYISNRSFSIEDVEYDVSNKCVVYIITYRHKMNRTKCLFTLEVSTFPRNIRDYLYIEEETINTYKVDFHQLTEGLWYPTNNSNQ